MAHGGRWVAVGATVTLSMKNTNIASEAADNLYHSSALRFLIMCCTFEYGSLNAPQEAKLFVKYLMQVIFFSHILQIEAKKYETKTVAPHFITTLYLCSCSVSLTAEVQLSQINTKFKILVLSLELITWASVIY